MFLPHDIPVGPTARDFYIQADRVGPVRRGAWRQIEVDEAEGDEEHHEIPQEPFQERPNFRGQYEAGGTSGQASARSDSWQDQMMSMMQNQNELLRGVQQRQDQHLACQRY